MFLAIAGILSALARSDTQAASSKTTAGGVIHDKRSSKH
jgi:hypothetical protein